MTSPLATSKYLYYHSFMIRIEAQSDTTLSIPMHELRSNFLFASSQIVVGKKTFRDVLGPIPLPISHPLYGELKEGFPASFIFFALPSQQEPRLIRSNCLECKKKSIITINLIIIGDRVKFFTEFVESIKLMISRGFGHPVVSFVIVDIFENHPFKTVPIMKKDGIILSQPSMPIRYLDFEHNQFSRQQIIFKFDSPTLLYKSEDNNLKKEMPGVYAQNNGLFSFYHIVRSVTERSIKLSVLYCGAKVDDYETDKDRLIIYLQQATKLKLAACNLINIQLPDLKQKGRSDSVQLGGLIGTMAFIGHFNCYIPLLFFFQDLCVGKNIAYGLGKYSIS